jgi:hypothetical protein
MILDYQQDEHHLAKFSHIIYDVKTKSNMGSANGHSKSNQICKTTDAK